MRDPYETIITLLDKSHVEYETIQHEPVYTSEQAAAVRGLSMQQGAKSLLFKTKVGFVLVVVPGDKRIDSKRLKLALGIKEARFASPEEVQEQMGCEVGSCYPFGNIVGLRTLVDKTMGQNKNISCNPGRHDISLKFSYADYEKLVKPDVVSVVQ